MLSSTSVLTLTVVCGEPFFTSVSKRVRFLLRGPETASSISLETTTSSFLVSCSVLTPLCAKRESDERVVRLVDSRAVVALITFEVSLDIRDVRIVNVRGCGVSLPINDSKGSRIEIWSYP